MLKIKDNVDLEKLKEEWGFRFHYPTPMELKPIEDCKVTMYHNKYWGICINTVTRELYLDEEDFENGCLDIIYDLIQAGLIEKVSVEQ